MHGARGVEAGHWTTGIVAAGLLAAVVLGAVTVAGAAESGDLTARQAELRTAETAFAKTMADRDHAAFVKFLSPETVFFGRNGEMRGSQTVADAWAGFFEGANAPFSWRPEIAAVLDSGQLGLTSGPVFDPEGKQIGTFNSVWRRESDGSWKIVFDKGCPPCGQP